MGSIFSLASVSFQVGDKVLIDRVSFDIGEGSCFCIVGPSGSGKSTLIRLLNRLNVKTSGLLLYHDQPIESYPVQILRRRVAMVFQQTSVFPGTVLDNLKVPLLFKKNHDFSDQDPRFGEALQKAGLSISYLHENAELLSGGEQQRMSIARALLSSPEVLCLDEPTSALDVEASQEVVRTIKRLRGKTTIIMVNHRLEEVKAVATHVAFIDSGKIVEIGDVRTFFENPQSDRLKAFLRAYQREEDAQ